jgi:hypothetical protein|tara:strand:- start:39 stop:335 length:297 start_codon:yes stop_codon:yes gene_type:complete
MFFELYPGLWVSDYKSYPYIKKYGIDSVINLTKHKVNRSIPFTIETIPRLIYSSSSKNIVYLISNDGHLKYLVKYLIEYARIDERTAWQYIQGKYYLS